MTDGIGVAHFARRCQPRSGPAASSARARRALGPALALVVRRCRSRRARTRRRHRRTSLPDGLIALVANGGRDDAPRLGRDGREAGPDQAAEGRHDLDRDGRRATSSPPRWRTATTATSDPVHLGKSLTWRSVKAVGPERRRPRRAPTLRHAGIRRAAASRRSPATSCRAMASAVVLIDPSVGTSASRSRSIARWSPRRRSGSMRIGSSSSPATAPSPQATIVDAKDRVDLSDGPLGARLLAASADGHAGRDDGRAGRPGRRPRRRTTGSAATARRSPRSRRRTARRRRSRSRSTRSVSDSWSPGRPRTAASPWPSTTPDQAGTASRNRRSARQPRAPSSPGGARPNREIAAPRWGVRRRPAPRRQRSRPGRLRAASRRRPSGG